MNILNFLIKEKRIAGVEISNKVIRIAYFRPRKKYNKKTGLPEHELVFLEEPIAVNAISDGVVIDKESLGKALKDAWSRAGLRSHYAIVAIPENKIYSHIFPFPKAVDESHIREAVNLAIDFQLPFKKSDVYIGWEKITDAKVTNQILISSIPKTVADAYTEALNFAGIKVLALESHLASLARSIKLQAGIATLLTKNNPDGASIFILKDGTLLFSRTLPATLAKENSFLVNETGKIKTSFESEKKMPVVELPLEHAVIRDEYLKYPEFKEMNPDLQSKWLIAVGAAIRGEIPKGTDNHISLLSVGTAEAYAYQKTTTFISLVRNMTIGVSVFFLFTFFAAYLYILSLSQRSSQTISNVSISPVSQNSLAAEELVKRTNLLTQASAAILSTAPNWSILLDEINSHIIGGIVVSNFAVTSVSDPMSITGIAKDRNTLNDFKKTLQSSTYLTAVELPNTNLALKGDIPFSISFRLIDPAMLYFK